MGMPQIPDGKNRPTFDETLIDLLESVALEEMAIAHLMNAEGEKMQEVIRQYACGSACYCQLSTICQSTEHMINSLIMKEWLLMNKLHTIIEVNHTIGEDMYGGGTCEHSC